MKTVGNVSALYRPLISNAGFFPESLGSAAQALTDSGLPWRSGIRAGIRR